MSSPRIDRPARLRRLREAGYPVFAPSLLSCDFGRVDEVLRGLAADGVGVVHLDVMDGHFVPNLTFGAPLIAEWRKNTDITFDTHLMMTDPGRYLDDFVAAGCDTLTFHIEIAHDPLPLLRRIRSAGVEAGLSLNPATPVSTVEPFLDELDSVLVMSVQPGFGGQFFEPKVLEKCRRLKELRPNLRVSIDGGIQTKTARAAVLAGCDLLVAGSAVFRGGTSPRQALDALYASLAVDVTTSKTP